MTGDRPLAWGKIAGRLDRMPWYGPRGMEPAWLQACRDGAAAGMKPAVAVYSVVGQFEERRLMVTRNGDPYHDDKEYHMADKIGPTGAVSALCFKKDRAINLKIALWTIRPEAVTCKKCLRLLSK